MDEIDKTQASEEVWLNRAIEAARGIPHPTRPRSTCSDCQEALPEHRLYYGICVSCQAMAEAKSSGWRR